MNDSKSNNQNLSLDTLTGMQSVRATFRLSKNTISLPRDVLVEFSVRQRHPVQPQRHDSALLSCLKKYLRETPLDYCVF